VTYAKKFEADEESKPEEIAESDMETMVEIPREMYKNMLRMQEENLAHVDTLKKLLAEKDALLLENMKQMQEMLAKMEAEINRIIEQRKVERPMERRQSKRKKSAA